MTASQLIHELLKMPLDATVSILYDGALREEVSICYLSKSGSVGLGELGSVIYENDDRPEWAPPPEVDKHWKIIPE